LVHPRGWPQVSRSQTTAVQSAWDSTCRVTGHLLVTVLALPLFRPPNVAFDLYPSAIAEIRLVHLGNKALSDLERVLNTHLVIRHSRVLEGSFPKTSKSDRFRHHTVSSKEAKDMSLMPSTTLALNGSLLAFSKILHIATIICPRKPYLRSE